MTESPVNTPTVKSADINVTIKANLSTDGNTIDAEVTFDPLEGVITIVGKVDLKKKGCRAKTLPVTLNKQTPTGSLKGYIYDRPLTALHFSAMNGLLFCDPLNTTITQIVLQVRNDQATLEVGKTRIGY